VLILSENWQKKRAAEEAKPVGSPQRSESVIATATTNIEVRFPAMHEDAYLIAALKGMPTDSNGKVLKDDFIEKAPRMLQPIEDPNDSNQLVPSTYSVDKFKKR